MFQRTQRKPVAASDAVATDIDELQRQYRLMELTRKSHSDEKSASIRMQRASMEKLKRDNDRLKEDLALETRQAKHANNISTNVQISKLQDQGEMYHRKISVERKKAEELDKQIQRLEASILEQRKEMGGINASRENNSSVQKQIRILENRLDKALVKFNEALAHNKSLRETIDNLRRERIVFDGIYKKLESELLHKKQTMSSILQDSDSAYRARDLAHQEMLTLKAQADQQQVQFESEWSELGEMIEKDRKLKEFMKGQQRGGSAGAGGANGSNSGSKIGSLSNTASTSNLHAASSSAPASAGNADSTLETEETKLRKKVHRGAWGIAKDKQTISASMERVQSYEEAFAKIQKATKITDIDELVQTFVQAEDQNFSLFNYVNDLSHEIEKIEENITELKGEVRKFTNEKNAGDANSSSSTAGGSASNAIDVLRGGSASSGDPQIGAITNSGSDSTTSAAAIPTDAQRKRMLHDLELKLARTETQASQYDQSHQSALHTVSILKSGIQNLFYKIGGAESNSAASEMLGSAGVTESNMMQYLGMIEERTNELLTELIKTREENQAMEAHFGGGSASNGQEEEDADGDQVQVRATSSHASSHQQQSQSSSHQQPVTILAPTVGDEDDDEDGEADGGVAGNGASEDAERPMSERELRGAAAAPSGTGEE